MKQRRRIYYNVEQRNLMWDRWQKGDSIFDGEWFFELVGTLSIVLSLILVNRGIFAEYQSVSRFMGYAFLETGTRNSGGVPTGHQDTSDSIRNVKFASCCNPSNENQRGT